MISTLNNGQEKILHATYLDALVTSSVISYCKNHVQLQTFYIYLEYKSKHRVYNTAVSKQHSLLPSQVFTYHIFKGDWQLSFCQEIIHAKYGYIESGNNLRKFKRVLS